MKNILAKLFVFEGYAYLYILTIILCIIGMMNGYFVGTIAGTEQPVASYFKMGEIGSNYMETIHSLVVAAPILGCCLGAYFSTYIRRWLGGKKYALILTAFLFIISAIGSYHPEILLGKIHRLSPEESGWGVFISLMFFRIIGGIATGISSVLGPMYMTELVPAEKRGKLVTAFYLFNTLGLMFAFLVNSLLYRYHSIIYQLQDFTTLYDTGWRHMFVAIAFLAILMLAVVFVLPHSPRELILDGKIKEAKNTFLLLYGYERSQKIMGELQQSFNVKRVNLFSYGRRVVLLCVGMAFCQQFIGYNVIICFLPRLMSDLTICETATAVQLSVILILMATLSMIVTFIFIDKLGRKPLMVSGTILILISLILIFVFKTIDGINPKLCYIPMALYFIGYPISGGSTCMVYIYEVLPNEIRRQGSSYVQTLSWIFNLVLILFVPHLYANNGWIIYTILILTTITAIAMVIILLPETKGMTLEQIGKYWSIRENKKATVGH